MSKIRKLMMVIATLLAFSAVTAACTDAQQYAFFVTLGDRVEADSPRTLEQAGAELHRARSEWTPESATPAQNAVLTELARQAREREQFEAYIRGIEQGRRATQLHPFLVCVRHHESDRGGYPHINGYGAQNPISTASGAYQFVDGTWRNTSARAGYGGYPTAAHAPWWVQDAVALWLYNSGGKSAWNGTGC